MAEHIRGPFGIRTNTHRLGGSGIPGHAHNFAHMSYVRWGGWKIAWQNTNRPVERVIAPWHEQAWVMVPAEAEHEITRVEVPPSPEMVAAMDRLLADTLAMAAVPVDVAQALAERFKATAVEIANPIAGRMDCLYVHVDAFGRVAKEYSGRDDAYV